MRVARILFLVGLVLTGCGSAGPGPQRLPTRASTAEAISFAEMSEEATPFPVSAEQYYDRGLVLRRAGDVDGALQHLTWALQREPDAPQVYVARGAIYLGHREAELALQDADAALGIEPSADALLLRAEAFRILGRHQEALEAFDQVLEMDPEQRDETFTSRWWAARAGGDADRLGALAAEYARAHPDDPLIAYYQGWATLASGASMDALRLLVRSIRGAADPPAVLWYALSQAYVEEGAWKQAVTALETARRLLEAGDETMGFHAERPVAELFIALGEAYLGAGRCVDARSMLAYAGSIGAPAATYMPTLQEAQRCPTPTPAPTGFP